MHSYLNAHFNVLSAKPYEEPPTRILPGKKVQFILAARKKKDTLQIYSKNKKVRLFVHCLCSFSAQAVISAILRSSESLQDHWGRDMLLGNRFPHSIYTERSVFHYLKALSLFLYPSPSQRRTHIHTLTRFDPCGMAYCSLYNNFRTQFELLIGFSSLIKKEQRMEQFVGFVL